MNQKTRVSTMVASRVFGLGPDKSSEFLPPLELEFVEILLKVCYTLQGIKGHFHQPQVRKPLFFLKQVWGLSRAAKLGARLENLSASR